MLCNPHQEWYLHSKKFKQQLISASFQLTYGHLVLIKRLPIRVIWNDATTPILLQAFFCYQMNDVYISVWNMIRGAKPIPQSILKTPPSLIFTTNPWMKMIKSLVPVVISQPFFSFNDLDRVYLLKDKSNYMIFEYQGWLIFPQHFQRDKWS